MSLDPISHMKAVVDQVLAENPEAQKTVEATWRLVVESELVGERDMVALGFAATVTECLKLFASGEEMPPEEALLRMLDGDPVIRARVLESLASDEE